MTAVRKWKFNGAVLQKFMKSRAAVQITQGPIRSGTSVGCCVKIGILTREMEPGPDGWKRGRWYVVRKTYDELKRTTLLTWKDVWPEGVYGKVAMTPPYQHIIRDEINKIELDVTFLALESEADVSKLMSAEVTGFWFNEGQFHDKAIIDEAKSRTGFGPNNERKTGCGWYGVIVDMNAPTEDHWVPRMRGDVPLPEDMSDDEKREFEKPDDLEFFVQPPGLIEEFDERGKLKGYKANPKAENLENIGSDYYTSQAQGKARRWVDSRIMNRVLLRVDGQPVWPEFRPELHVSNVNLKPTPGAPIICGLDFARNPAVVFGQHIRGQWTVLHEMVGENVGSTVFAPTVKQEIAKRYPGYEILMWGDPTGASKTGLDDQTQYAIFKLNGMLVRPAPGWNAFELRKQAVESLLTRLTNGSPSILIDPRCIRLKAAMGGGYAYKRIQGTGNYHERPDKNRHSDVADALQYLVLGGGAGRDLIAAPKKKPQSTARKRFSLTRRR